MDYRKVLYICGDIFHWILSLLRCWHFSLIADISVAMLTFLHESRIDDEYVGIPLMNVDKLNMLHSSVAI